MSVFSYHIVRTSLISALEALFFPPRPANHPGLIHAECMTVMTLGAPLFSPARLLLRQLVVFAQWESEAAVDHFLVKDKLGRLLAKGWHTRLRLVRQWGHISDFQLTNESGEPEEINGPVVAVTLARMKLPEVPRFIRWGRPVETLVRDHPGTTLSLASIRLPRTVSTFSVWNSQKEMTDMVQGHSAVPHPKRHVNAMGERDRRDFHFEFTTLRFRPLSESGAWNGRVHIIPKLNSTN
ncbi:MAG TPA: hypothetical protein VHK69_21225 [Chitinophagaceae bacterium]|jgi:hypothetical protein|nr:hypothetical protein [Chitinophagaceae bacterium]